MNGIAIEPRSKSQRLIDLDVYPVKQVLNRLLQDKTTKKNIIFATDAYSENGEDFSETSQITKTKLSLEAVIIQTRVEKATAEQAARTRKKAEVFTPSWIVNKMNNHCDEEWFGCPNVFNTEDGEGWTTTESLVPFVDNKAWQAYVDSKRLEITCGEAPYIVSRYDASTGAIIPIANRIGILDRKLRVVNENALNDAEWLKWSERALQSSYGYEFQGDNLLIARVNVLTTMVEHYEQRFGEKPDIKYLRRIANIICWNFWQMDGLTGTIPFCVPEDPAVKDNQMSIESFFDEVIPEDRPNTAPICKIRNWRAGNAVSYETIKRR